MACGIRKHPGRDRSARDAGAGAPARSQADPQAQAALGGMIITGAASVPPSIKSVFRLLGPNPGLVPDFLQSGNQGHGCSWHTIRPLVPLYGIYWLGFGWDVPSALDRLSCQKPTITRPAYERDLGFMVVARTLVGSNQPAARSQPGGLLELMLGKPHGQSRSETMTSARCLRMLASCYQPTRSQLATRSPETRDNTAT